MKKYLFAVLFATLVVMATPAFAKDGIPGGDRGPRETLRAQFEEKKAEFRADREAQKAEFEAKREAAKGEIEARKAELRLSRASSTDDDEIENEREMRKASSTAKRIELQQGLAKRKVENTAKVLTATIERLEKIIVRIESRITKIKAAGGNTSESEAFIAAAKSDLEAAKISITTFSGLDLTSDKAKDNFETARIAAKEVKNHIKDAHENLMKATRALGKFNSGDHATTTPKTATSTEE